jgi:2,3-bisphosphoglycerate-independent phosphoglycerate mutase
MKYIILIGDGMADEPLEELGGKTPLETAHTPHMDELARRAGTFGLVKTIPEGYEPGSDVANMAILGYDPRRYYTGRAPLEAASIGIELTPDDVALRCNLVALREEDGRLVMADYSAGHIPTDEAKKLIELLKPELEDKHFKLYAGVSYRHLLVWRGGRDDLTLTPPHNIQGEPIEPHLPQGEGSGFLIELMERARAKLSREGGRANALWFWGAGRKPRLPTLKERFGIEGSVISAVDLVRGLGALAGLKVIHVRGATGYLDTNYEGKAQAALKALSAGDDLVYVHVEAPDEVSHEGNLKKKLQAIEDFDAKIVGPIAQALQSFEKWTLLLMPDHPTPLKKRVHTSDPVPFLVARSSKEGEDRERIYSERAACKTGVSLDNGYTLIERLLPSPSQA